MSFQKPLLLDGAIGTLLQTRGLPSHRPSDYWNLEKPEEVLLAHQKYIQAGSQVILTNTLCSSRNHLKEQGITNQQDINQKAYQLARQAAEDKVLIGGSMGPIGTLKEPFELLKKSKARALYEEQMSLLEELGVNFIVFETQFNPQEIILALSCAKNTLKISYGLSMTVNSHGLLKNKTAPENLLDEITQYHPAFIGFNCATGPASLIKPLERFNNKTTIPLWIKPNAGLPLIHPITKKIYYPLTPQKFAGEIKKIMNQQVGYVGGCCGTTPKHISVLHTTLKGSR